MNSNHSPLPVDEYGQPYDPSGGQNFDWGNHNPNVNLSIDDQGFYNAAPNAGAHGYFDASPNADGYYNPDAANGHPSDSPHQYQASGVQIPDTQLKAAIQQHLESQMAEYRSSIQAEAHRLAEERDAARAQAEAAQREMAATIARLEALEFERYVSLVVSFFTDIHNI